MLHAEAMALDSGVHDRNTRIHALVVELLGLLLRATLEETDAAIDAALAGLGRFCDVDRVYVFRLREGGGQELVDNTHEWVAPGTEPAIELCQGLPADWLASWRPRFDADAPVEIADVAALPADDPLRAHLLEQGIVSLLAVPMRAAGRLVGFVGFDAVRGRRGFPAAEVFLLKAVADAIGSVLARAASAAEIARTQEGLAEARNRLGATLNALPDLVLEVDADGRYLAVHTADPGQMMVPAERLIGSTHEEAVPAEMAALNRRAMAEVDRQGRSGPHYYTAHTPRGPRRYSLTVAPRPPHRAGDRPGYVFIARDVSEEWRLQREAERLSLIAQRMTDLVMVIGLDDRIEWVNPAFEARTGWRLDEVRGRTPGEVLHAPGTDRAEIARIAAAMDAGEPVSAELLNRTRDGEEFWTEIDIQPLHDAEGRLTGFVSIETDVTERKAQAAALARLALQATEARARLEMAVEALPDAFAYFDADDRLVLCNARYRTYYPMAGRLMVPGARFVDLVRAAVESGEVPDALGDEESWIAERIARHECATSSEVRRVSGDRWLRVIERATPDGGRVGMRIDITELKRAEQRLADIIQGAEAGTWEWTVPTGENLINERWAEIVGYTLDELAPLTIDVWRGLLHPDDLAAAEARLARVFAREEEQFEYELRMRHKAGHWVWVMSRGRVARWAADGTPEVMAGVHMDITALKRAEERLEQIIDAADAGTWEADFATGEKRINDRWAGMLGYTRAELAPRPHFGFRELIHPEDLARLEVQHDEALARGVDSFANEIRMRHREGHWVWILSSGRVLGRDAEGRPTRTAGIHLDITPRKLLETQLMAERDYLARLMETSASGITALDGAGRIIFANREAERILGLAASRMDGMLYDAPDWQISDLDGRPFPPGALPYPRVLAEGVTVRNVRFAITRPDGARRMLSVNAAPLRAEGLEVRVVCSINDITEQVAAEAELRGAALRAEAANRAKSQFLANMSHEIRTPLNGVLGMAQLLEDELEAPQHRRMLGTIRESGELLLGILNDILDMSKIEAGKMEIETVAFVPAELAARIEALHRHSAAERELALCFEMDAGARRPRLGDPGRLAQVLHNLVGNAVKFTEAGSVTVRIEGAGEGLRLVVRDTGIGMTDEQLARIFEDFEQADGTVTRRFGGTGLGMSIVRRLVALMGGQVSVLSAPGQGTEVEVRLPLSEAAPAPHGRAAEVACAAGGDVGSGGGPGVVDAPGSAAAPAGEGRGALRPVRAGPAGLRALAADDNATNRLILRAMLVSLGIEVTLVADGRAAVEAWAPGRFDLLLLDISMPDLDGIGALAEIRAREAAAGTAPAPALAITANAMAHQVAEYLDAGFAAHVGKPFRREDLATAIAGALPVA